jgi:upstream activation factor subunit UAF30
MTTKSKKEATSSGKGSTKDGAEKMTAFNKPLQPSTELAAVVGPEPLPRTEVVSKVWDYIRTHKLQNPENKREIVADEKLKAVFGRDKVTMFEMNKYLAQHLK